MIQEYLLQDLAEKDTVKAYKPQNIQKRMFSADNGKCWYVQYSADGENEETAKLLSAIDAHMRTHFHVTVLNSGCSAYFNRRLYPLINEFENSLRKLLYLTSAINHDEKSGANIAGLESQDFGQIFTLLFVDANFMGKVKDEIKTRNRDAFSKADVIAAIESIDENTLWDALLGKNSVPMLRKRFNDVRTYRNDVMHSHHIGWERYREILALYKAINTELDKALHDIEVVESKAPSKPTFNQTLEGALRAQEMVAAIADAMKPSMADVQHMAALYASNPAITELQQSIKEFLATYTFSPEMLREISQLGQLAREIVQSNSTFFQKTDSIDNTQVEESNPADTDKKDEGDSNGKDENGNA